MENDLRIHKVAFKNFRSYRRLDLEDVGNLTIFVGPNGVGKTNILEGIQLLCACTSFKHPSVEELVLEGSTGSFIQIACASEQRKIDISLSIADHKKSYRVNGKNKTSVEVKGTLPAVMFCPDDLEIAKKSSSVKRAAIDELGSQITKNYHVIQRDYEKIIRYKNQLLKDEAALGLVQSINDTLVTCASQLIVYRLSLYGKIMRTLAGRYASISGGSEVFSSLYSPSWCEKTFTGQGDELVARDEVRELLTSKLEANIFEERERKRSLIGPHADKIDFFLAGKNVSSYASQGQQRSVILAFKLAEVEILKEVTHQNPVLLLDDVMSELDEDRRRALVELVERDIQTFITTTNLSYFDNDLLNRANIVSLPFEMSEQGV